MPAPAQEQQQQLHSQQSQQQQPQQQPQQPQPPQQLYQHFFGVLPRQPSPGVTSYKARIRCGVAIGGTLRKSSKVVQVAACPTPGEAAVARDLAMLWKEHRCGAAAVQQQEQRPEQQQQQQESFNFDRAR